jgi:A/G-specific adenine glycosylase
VSEFCAAQALGTPEHFPVRGARAKRPTRTGHAFVAVRTDGAIRLRRRPPSGLLGGMAEVPGGEWVMGDRALPATDAPFDAAWRKLPAPVVHVFTHFRLELTIHRAGVAADIATPDRCWWSPPGELPGEALPSLMRKVIEAAVPNATKRGSRSAA